jgi:hypothetical protein
MHQGIEDFIGVGKCKLGGKTQHRCKTAPLKPHLHTQKQVVIPLYFLVF